MRSGCSEGPLGGGSKEGAGAQAQDLDECREGRSQGLKRESSLSRGRVGLNPWGDHEEARQSLGPLGGVMRVGGLEPSRVTKGQTVVWEAKVTSIHCTS